MTELERLMDVARRVEPGLFVRSRPGLYLLGAYPSAPDSPVARQRRRKFATAPAISVDEMMSYARRPPDDPLRGRFLCRVEKTERNPFSGRISVGRAPNNDVTLVHPSVSKLHAHFLLPRLDKADTQDLPLPRRTPLPWAPGPATGGTAPRAGEPLLLVDVGSRNGTFLNGTPVPADAPTPVSAGAEIRFGDVACVLLDAEQLYAQLQTLAG